ncbi:MAG TPA: PadR family transcriptional regulator [Solirubrobacteraceae bacterium]|nr:PadR family transcriptional regulator [Solirubrobacteraceae bacterium]
MTPDGQAIDHPQPRDQAGPAPPAPARARNQAEPAARAPALNNTARVLLGMIAEGHATGYAIKNEIERSTRLYWGASIGGIYPELRRLQAAGLVAVRDNPRGGATRHAYTLTPAGRRALERWLTDDCEPTLEMRHEALLRLRFAGVLDAREQRQLLARMRLAHERRASALRARIAAGHFDDPMHRMAVEFGLGFNEWAIGWCDQAARRLRREASRAARRPDPPRASASSEARARATRSAGTGSAGTAGRAGPLTGARESRRDPRSPQAG